MTKYWVVWDQEYAKSDHDEYLTVALPKEEAEAFAEGWAAGKVRAAFPTLERSANPEQYDALIEAKMKELSFISAEERLDKCAEMAEEVGIDIESDCEKNIFVSYVVTNANHRDWKDFYNVFLKRKSIKTVEDLSRLVEELYSRYKGAISITVLYWKELD